MKGKKEIVEAIRAAVEAQLTKQGIDAHTWQHDKSFSDVGLDSLDMVAVAR